MHFETHTICNTFNLQHLTFLIIVGRMDISTSTHPISKPCTKIHIKNHHRMQQKSFSFWYIIWLLLNTRRFWRIFASKSKFRTMLVNSLLNLPNLLSNSDPLRFLFGDYCSKSGLNLAKMGLVLCHFNLLRF